MQYLGLPCEKLGPNTRPDILLTQAEMKTCLDPKFRMETMLALLEVTV